MRRSILSAVAFGSCVALGLAAAAVSSPQSTNESAPFSPTSFGVNINEALLNPLEVGATEADLRTQVALILYDVRMMGGRTVRWIPTDISPQYDCSIDPEDQRTGQIDPAWYVITRILLQEAKRQGLRAVIVLTDLTRGKFAGQGPDQGTIAPTVDRWAEYRSSHPASEYRRTAGCVGAFRNGYYGEQRDDDLFRDPTLLAHLTARSVTMAKYLGQFSALGAIELFNEPDFAVTHTYEYAKAVQSIRDALTADSSIRSVPIVSGTSSWDARNIEVAASNLGYFAAEPYLSVHAYGDYRDSATVRSRLDELIKFLRRLAPTKSIVISEAGSKSPMPEPAQNRAMVTALLDIVVRQHVGLWVWGNWIPGSDRAPDYRTTFNVRALSGSSFRGLVTDSDHEVMYSFGRWVGVSTLKGEGRNVLVAIEPEKSGPAGKSGTWIVTVDNESFIGVSHAGIFPRPYPGGSAAFATPEGSVFLPQATGDNHWLEISYTGDDHWRLDLHACTAAVGTSTVLTPLYVLALAHQHSPASLPSNCTRSVEVFTGVL